MRWWMFLSYYVVLMLLVLAQTFWIARLRRRNRRLETVISVNVTNGCVDDLYKEAVEAMRSYNK